MTKTKSSRIWYYYEKFRAFLLVFLMVLCIIQVGILWSSQSGSFPFSFLGRTKAGLASLEDSKSYLLPSQIVLSDGYDGDHFVIPNGTKDYNDLWSSAKEFIPEVLKTKPKQSQTFSETKWAKLAANKAFFFEFKTQVPVEIFRWILNMDDSAGGELTSVYKFLICPDDPDNGYADTLYIRDGLNIYTYSVPEASTKTLTAEKFNKIYNDQKKREDDGESVRNFKMAIEINDTRYPQDMLAPMISSQVDNYPDISCRPLAEIDEQASSFTEYDLIAQELFGKAKNDFYPDEDVNGSLIFKKSDGFYKIYKNSILEYKYIGSQVTQEKTKLLDAYKNAVSFIVTHKLQSSYMKDITIYLTSIEQKSNSYKFNFDFAISDKASGSEFPVYIEDYIIPNTGEKLLNAISIEADAKRVTNCKWLLLKYSIAKSEKKYGWSFVDMFAKVYNTHTEIKDEELTFKGYGIYYMLSNPQQDKYSITPRFVLFAENGHYAVPMDPVSDK